MPKNHLDINFHYQKGLNPSVKELQDFLEIVNQMHEYIVFYTQPEYQKAWDNKNKKAPNINHYHQLEIKTICRENPFVLKLIFRLNYFGVAPYYTIFKILIDICKRYGKDFSHLYHTKDSVLEILREFETKIKDIYPKIDADKNSNLLGLTNEYINTEKVCIRIEENFNKLMSNKRFIVLYNKFCNSLFILDNIVSIIDLVSDSGIEIFKYDLKNNEI
jgi:hypothetical protein